MTYEQKPRGFWWTVCSTVLAVVFGVVAWPGEVAASRLVVAAVLGCCLMLAAVAWAPREQAPQGGPYAGHLAYAPQPEAYAPPPPLPYSEPAGYYQPAYYQPPPYYAVPLSRRLRYAMTGSFNVIVGIAVAATLAGSIVAATSFQTRELDIPYDEGLRLLAHIARVTALPAVAVSWTYDVLAARRGAWRYAVRDWPWWHRLAVTAAAVLAPLAAIVISGDPDYFEHTGYGPPVYFWWLAPTAMLVMHSSCLVARALWEPRPG